MREFLECDCTICVWCVRILDKSEREREWKRVTASRCVASSCECGVLWRL